VEPDAAFAALRLGDSFLPTGGYTASYGLESFSTDEGFDTDSLAELLRSYVRGQVGPCDMVAVGAAHEAARNGEFGRVAAIDERVRAVTLSAEARESATAAGERLLDLHAELDPEGPAATYRERLEEGAPGNAPVATGVVAAANGVPAEIARILQGYAFLRDQLGAAQRVCRLGHTEAQRILVGVKPELLAAAEAAAERGVEDIASFAPEIELHAFEHERAERRLFVS
jgi:urease accessory protein